MRSGSGGLGALPLMRLQVLELLDDAESARRRLDPPGGLVARLLIVAPRPRLAAHREGLDALDDGVVRVHVAVEPADLAVGDDVEPRALHVADRGVGGVVEHLLEVGGSVLPRLVGADGGERPSNGSSSSSISASSASARAMDSILRSPPLISGPLRAM